MKKVICKKRVMNILGMSVELLWERRETLKKKDDGLITPLTVTDRDGMELNLIVRPAGAYAHQFMLMGSAEIITEAEQALERGALAIVGASEVAEIVPE